MPHLVQLLKSVVRRAGDDQESARSQLVVVETRRFTRNSALPGAVWDAFAAMPSQEVPRRVGLSAPNARVESVRGAGTTLATHPKHLFADTAGEFPAGSLSELESRVLERELPRCVAWYRNPRRASPWSLSVVFRDSLGQWRQTFPALVFFELTQGGLQPSIVDPQSASDDDADHRLRALAAFAEDHGEEFHRIEAVDALGGELQMLDLQRVDVRHAVAAAPDATTLYDSPLALAY